MVLEVLAIMKNTRGKKSVCYWCGTRKSETFAYVPSMDGQLCQRCFLVAEHGSSMITKLPCVSRDMDKLVIKFQILHATQPLTALEFDYWAATMGNILHEGSKKALQRCIEHKIIDYFDSQPDGELELDDSCMMGLQDYVTFEDVERYAIFSVPSMEATDSERITETHKRICHRAIQQTKIAIFGNDYMVSHPKDDEITNFMIGTILHLFQSKAAIGKDDVLEDLLITGSAFDLDKMEAVNLDEIAVH